MKGFKYDVILSREDLCDREKEQARLLSVMKRGGRLVIYSIRRMGKTSLATVCQERVREQEPKAFCLYVDLNEVTSLRDVAQRFRTHFEMALKEQMPLQRVRGLLNDLFSRMKVNLPGDVEISVDTYALKHPERYLLQLFRELGSLSVKGRLVITIDEFQAIAELRDVQALLRREFQSLEKGAVIVMGSNQRLLYKMFNDKKAPFFGFGEDLELGEIRVEDYLPYLNERFAARNLSVSEEVALFMLSQMNNIPNYINELGAWIIETLTDLELTRDHIDAAIEALVRSKRGRYESALYGYSQNQKAFLKGIARLGPVKSYTGREMQQATELSATELARLHTDLEDCPLLSRDTQNRLFLLDPFLRRFIESI